MRYDEELMIKDALALVQSKLNTKIAAINTEKNDALVLATIPNEQYIFETLTSEMLNYKGFMVLFGIQDTPIREQSDGSTIEDVVITFQIGTFDNGEKDRSNTLYKLLRYRRALKEIFQENPDVFRGYAKSKLKSLKPDAFPIDNKYVLITIGVDVTASLTNP